MKTMPILLTGLLLVPYISFAQTTVSRDTLLTEIAQLQAELNILESQINATSTNNNPNSQFQSSNPDNLPNGGVVAVPANTPVEGKPVFEWKTDLYGEKYEVLVDD